MVSILPSGKQEQLQSLRTISTNGDRHERGAEFFAISSPSHHVRMGMISLLAVIALASGSAWAQAEPGAAVRQEMQQGAQAMSTAHFSEAVADYTTVTHILPQFAEGYLDLGLALEQDGQLAAASQALEKSLALKPDLRGANLFLGLIAYRQNHFKDAESRLQRETRIDPRDAKAFMWLGVCYLAEDKPEAAIEPLNRAYVLDPTDADILYHRGHAYLLMADASYAAMFKLNHDSMRVHQVLAEAYAKSYRTQEAISEFQLAIKQAPHQPGLHEELANQYWIAGQFDKAAGAYREELGIDPYSAITMYKLGCLLVMNNHPADGVQFLNSALHADPSLTDAHYYLGEGLAALGRTQDAIAQYKEMIAVNPSSDRAMRTWYKLAMVYRSTGNHQELQQAITKFRSMKSLSEAKQERSAEQLVQSRMSLPVQEPVSDSVPGTEQAAASAAH